MTILTMDVNGEPDKPDLGRVVQWPDSITKTLKSKDDQGVVSAYGDTKKSLCSSNDTLEGFLEDKIVGGASIVVVTSNEGGNELITISSAAGNVMSYAGGYNAATNTPDLDTAPSGITAGSVYTVTVGGNFFTELVEPSDMLTAEIDNPTVLTDWTVVQANLTPATIKSNYELNADTNAFTDADVTALANAGDLSGPASSVDNAVARFDGTTGKLLQDYTSNAPVISDDGDLQLAGDLIVRGSTGQNDFNLYRSDATDHGFSLSGTVGNKNMRFNSDSYAMDLNKSGMTFYIGNSRMFLNGTGTAAGPLYSFRTDTNTGMYNPAGDTLAFASGGVQTLEIKADRVSAKVASGQLITIVSTNTTLGIHHTVLVDTSGGDITITLPVAAASEGIIYNIKKKTGDNNKVTIVGTIDGSTNLVIIFQNDSASLHCDGTEWWII